VNAAKAPLSISQAPREAGAERHKRDRHRVMSIIANPRRVGAIQGAMARLSALSGELRRADPTAALRHLYQIILFNPRFC
jgi:hypothetical protein